MTSVIERELRWSPLWHAHEAADLYERASHSNEIGLQQEIALKQQARDHALIGIALALGEMSTEKDPDATR